MPASGRPPWDTCWSPPPDGFTSWDDWRRDIGLPESDRGIGADSINDPRGEGPRIWFHVASEAKVGKNRVHLDVHAGGGSGATDRSVPLATRRRRVDDEARRLTALGATATGALGGDSLDHYAMGMKDPEGNEFEIN